MKLLKKLAFVLAASLMLTSCGGGGSTPSSVAKKFAEATKNLDFKEAKKYVAKEYAEDVDEIIEQLNSPEAQAYMGMIKEMAKSAKIEVFGEKISDDGNSATVTIKTEVMGQTHEEDLPLIKEDGVWKVDEKPSMGK